MPFPLSPHAAGLELTLACPCRCATCGSRAGRARGDELTTREWLTVIADLGDLGCRRLSFLGGEPLAFPDWPRLAEAAVARGFVVELITSGMGVDAEVAQTLRDVGLCSVTVSVDGLAATHDAQRGIAGGHAQALRAIAWLDGAGLKVGVNTQLNRATLPDLEALAPLLQDAGAMGWQWQLTMPRGRARELEDLLLAPADMPAVHALVTRLQRRLGLRPHLTDNLGYGTPDDTRLRTNQGGFPSPWRGCQAGLYGVGITSDGFVKGCLALPDSAREGNLRDEPLAAIWKDPRRFAYNRAFSPATLSGPCATCPRGARCRGGCHATALTFHGKTGTSAHCFRVCGAG
jgi:radical SAM protein with 4Fe4S-binding SPASM domain